MVLSPPADTSPVLDVLINNAGAGYSTSIADADIAKAKQLFDVNFFGVIAVTQAFTPLLIASGDARILNIGSVLGEIYRPFTGIYNSAKAALAMTSETMRVELAPFGIKVIHVVTGGISTNLIATGSQVTFPETSIYIPIREQAAPYIDGSAIQSAMTTPADEYARAVVANTLKSAPNPYFWYGSETGLVWFASLFVPRSWLDNRYAKAYGFTRLAEILGVGGSKPKDI
jgi:1-acylglycerone phosphate reductase